MKVVVDTNVFIEALFQDNEWCRKILDLEYNGYITFVMNEEMCDELIVVFAIHASKINGQSKKVVSIIRKIIKPFWRIQRVDHITKCNISSDSDDNKFIDCAIDSKCPYIITQDGEHLFGKENEIKDTFGHKVEILSPYQFCTRVLKNRMSKR